MRALLQFLLRRETVLIAFLLIKAVTATANGLALNSGEAWGIGLLALATYSVIAWFACKGRLVSIWAISLIMLFEGSGLLLRSLADFPEAPVPALIGMAVTAYLFLGTLIVFSSRRDG